MNPDTPWRFDLAGWSREATAGPAADFMALFQHADRLGFDGFWLHEFRLLAESGPYPSPLLLAAAVLARTERLRVGISALVLPLHQPLLLAEELLQLQFQSGDRLDAGVGRGTDPSTLLALGIDPATTRDRFEAGCRTLMARAPGVPLYVAGSTPETLGFALANNLPLLLSLEPPEIGQLARVHELLAGAEPSAALYRSPITRYICIAPTRAQCDATLTALWDRLQARRVYFATKRGEDPAQIQPIDPERMLREQFIHGPPEDCITQLQALRNRTGLHHLRCVFNANGQLDNTTALDAMTLFAQEVMPVLQKQI
jgi:alkanesulfonate monooxygenase SsuD/methylene tetrahydromethanopterin reductase-like flavin-dependent oxidoreductase (luciferase family)